MILWTAIPMTRQATIAAIVVLTAFGSKVRRLITGSSAYETVQGARQLQAPSECSGSQLERAEFAPV